MPRPTPQPVNLEDLARLAQSVMKATQFSMLATSDGDQPRVRPVSPVRTEGFTVYVANLRSYHKTVELAANPKVELCYVDDNHNQVRIAGAAQVLSDRRQLQDIWDSNPSLRENLESLDNPELIIYRIVPERVCYMQEWGLDYYEVPLG